jgi:hypothetical protein
MSNFLKLTNGKPIGTQVQGTDIGSGAATSTQFLAASGSGSSAFRSLASSDLPTITLTSDVTGSASGGSIATTIANNAVTNAKFRQSAGLSVVGNSTSSTANVADITGTANQVLVVNSAGTSLGFGAVNLASSAAVTGTLPNANTTATNNATASTIMSRDANANTRINSIIDGFTATATAAGTTTLTVSSTYTQQFTGTTTQTVVLPDATTLVIGQQFSILNRSTGIVTVNANGGGLVQTMVGNSQTVLTVTSVSTSAGVWDSSYTINPSLTSLGIFAGKQAISNGTSTVSVTFSTAFGTTNYAITCNLLNVTDTNPVYQSPTITTQATTGFTAKLNGPVPTANYLLSWTAIANN